MPDALESGEDLELAFEQRPALGGWVHLIGGCTFVLGPGALLVGMVKGIGLAVFAGLGIFFCGMGLGAGAAMFQCPVRLTFTPVSLRVSAWTGTLARPSELRLSLTGLRLTHTRLGEVEGDTLHHLNIMDASQKVTIPGLICTTNELERLFATAQRRREEARPRMGAGPAEVPEALRHMLKSSSSES